MIEESAVNFDDVKDELTLEKATEIMRKLRFVRAQINERKRVAEKEHERISKWLNEELEEWTGREQHYEFVLLNWIQEQHAKNPKFKLSTPYGKSSIRNVQSWHWQDDKVLGFLRDHVGTSELVKVQEVFDKNEFKRRKDLFDVKDGKVVFTETGEVVEGVSVTPDTKYTIKVTEEAEGE